MRARRSKARGSRQEKSSHAFDLLHDGALEQLGRQKALRDHEVVKFALLEARPEREFRLEPQLPQPRVAVEGGDRLAGHPERVTVRLLLRERFRKSYLAHEKCFGLVGGHPAEIDHRVEERPRSPQETKLKREQLPFQGKVGNHQALGVKAPALRVGAVEGECRAGERDTALDHRRELQLVAGPRLVRRQRPCRRLSGEIIDRIGRLCIRILQRQDELAHFAPVAYEPRRVHEGRSHGGRLGLAREPDGGRALRQADDALAHHDLLDGLEAITVEDQDPIARHRAALQLADDVALVRRREIPFTRNSGGEARRLVANLGEREGAHRDRLFRLQVDPRVLQAVGVQLARQHVLFARARKDGGLHPFRVVAQLRREPDVRRLPVAQPARAKQLGNPRDVAFGVVEVLPHLSFVGPDELRNTEAFTRTRARELGERRAARLHPGVASHALQGVAPPRLVVARIEQYLEPLKNVSRQVEVGDEEAILERAGAPPALDRVDEDVEVLPHLRIGFRFSPRRQQLQHASCRGVIALRILRVEVEHGGIEAIDTQFRRKLGVESALHLDYDRGVAVAALDPGWFRGEGGKRDDSAHYGAKKEAKLARSHVEKSRFWTKGAAMISRRSGLRVAIRLESPRQEDVMRLLAALDAYLESLYPPQSNHILDVDTLCAPDIRFFVARRGGEALGCGALRIDSTGYGEVKRMFVHPEARGQKLGRAILMRIEEQASHEGLEWMRLETGIHQAAALALYRRAGYAERGPFGEYRSDPLSHFFEKSIDPGAKRRAARGG